MHEIGMVCVYVDLLIFHQLSYISSKVHGDLKGVSHELTIYWLQYNDRFF